MVAVILAVLGVPIWLVAGMLLGALYSRRRYRRAPGVFRCKIRQLSRGTSSDSGDLDGDESTPAWGRAPAYARWVHDVLLVSRGVALVRLAALPVAAVAAGPRTAHPPMVKGLGPAPVVVSLRLDDGSVIELAAAEDDDVTIWGPYADAPGASHDG
jgi:hypothetical protein